MSEPIVLKLRDALTRSLEAARKNELLFQNFVGICETPLTYSGPCAIGACLTPEERVFLDNQKYLAIDNLIRAGAIISDNEQGLRELQRFHDQCYEAADLAPSGELHRVVANATEAFIEYCEAKLATL